jgi:serine/threonine protein kinase
VVSACGPFNHAWQGISRRKFLQFVPAILVTVVHHLQLQAVKCGGVRFKSPAQMNYVTCSAVSVVHRAYAEYRLVAKKGEGTFSEVLKAQCIKNGKYVAIKCMKNHFDSLDQVR